MYFQMPSTQLPVGARHPFSRIITLQHLGTKLILCGITMRKKQLHGENIDLSLWDCCTDSREKKGRVKVQCTIRIWTCYDNLAAAQGRVSVRPRASVTFPGSFKLVDVELKWPFTLYFFI